MARGVEGGLHNIDWALSSRDTHVLVAYTADVFSMGYVAIADESRTLVVYYDRPILTRPPKLIVARFPDEGNAAAYTSFKISQWARRFGHKIPYINVTEARSRHLPDYRSKFVNPRGTLSDEEMEKRREELWKIRQNGDEVAIAPIVRASLAIPSFGSLSGRAN